MNAKIDDEGQFENALRLIIEKLCQDPLCMEIRHYPASEELEGNKKLHLLIITKRELKQSEHRQRMETLNELSARLGTAIDAIFSSPKVWQALAKLVGPCARIERESTVDWRRNREEG